MKRIPTCVAWTLVAVGCFAGASCRRAAPPQPGPGLDGLAVALDFYCMQMGDYPDSLDDSNVVARLKSYHPEVSLKDSWGHSVQYRKIGPGSVELRSAGPDGSMGTRDDVIIRRGPSDPSRGASGI